MSESVYVIHPTTRQVFACFGQGKHAVELALEYAARRYALSQYLAMRAGFAPTVSVPMAIVYRPGRRLSPGASLKGKGGVYPSDGKLRPRRKVSETTEAVCLLPAARDKALSRLQRRWPNTWRRYGGLGDLF